LAERVADEPKEDEVFRRVMTDVIPALRAL
jgi:hypothetical protein